MGPTGQNYLPIPYHRHVWDFTWIFQSYLVEFHEHSLSNPWYFDKALWIYFWNNSKFEMVMNLDPVTPKGTCHTPTTLGAYFWCDYVWKWLIWEEKKILRAFKDKLVTDKLATTENSTPKSGPGSSHHALVRAKKLRIFISKEIFKCHDTMVGFYQSNITWPHPNFTHQFGMAVLGALTLWLRVRLYEYLLISLPGKLLPNWTDSLFGIFRGSSC